MSLGKNTQIGGLGADFRPKNGCYTRVMRVLDGNAVVTRASANVQSLFVLLTIVFNRLMEALLTRHGYVRADVVESFLAVGAVCAQANMHTKSRSRYFARGRFACCASKRLNSCIALHMGLSELLCYDI